MREREGGTVLGGAQGLRASGRRRSLRRCVEPGSARAGRPSLSLPARGDRHLRPRVDSWWRVAAVRGGTKVSVLWSGRFARGMEHACISAVTPRSRRPAAGTARGPKAHSCCARRRMFRRRANRAAECKGDRGVRPHLADPIWRRLGPGPLAARRRIRAAPGGECSGDARTGRRNAKGTEGSDPIWRIVPYPAETALLQR